MLTGRDLNNPQEIWQELLTLWKPVDYKGFQENESTILSLIAKQAPSIKDALITKMFVMCKTFLYEKDSNSFLKLFSELSLDKRSEIANDYDLHRAWVHCDKPSRSFYYDTSATSGLTIYYKMNGKEKKPGYAELIKHSNSMNHDLILSAGKIASRGNLKYKTSFFNFSDIENILKNELILDSLTEESKQEVIKHLEFAEKSSHQRLVHSSNIAKIAALLPEKDRMNFANDHLFPITWSRDIEVAYFIPHIPSNQQLIFLETQKAKYQDGRDLESALKKLNKENIYAFLQKHIDKINQPSQIDYVRISVVSAIRYLSPEDAYKIAEQCIDRIAIKEFNTVLEYLPKDKRYDFSIRYNQQSKDSFNFYTCIEEIMQKLLDEHKLNFLEYAYAYIPKDIMERNISNYLLLLPISDRSIFLGRHTVLISKILTNNLQSGCERYAKIVSLRGIFGSDNNKSQLTNDDQLDEITTKIMFDSKNTSI